MSLNLITKIIFISFAILFITIGAITSFNSVFFTREYSKAIQTRTLTLGKMLKFQLDRLIGFNIPINDLVGFEEQCQAIVNKHEGVSYAMVIDTEGKILFHSDTSQHGRVISDSGILSKIKTQNDILRICMIKEEKFCDFIIPVFGSHNEHIATVRIGFPTKLIINKTRSMIYYSIGFASIFLGFGIVLLIISLNFWISKPLKKLVAAINLIRQEGTTSYQLIQIDSKDEIGQLASGFNQMILEIREYNETIEVYTQELELKVKKRTTELEEANKQLKQDITKRKIAEEELVQAYNELKATQAQLVQSSKLDSIGELASGIAHELNQPLTVIRGNVQFLLRNLQKNIGIDELTKQLEQIEKNTKRTMNIINHLRFFSRQTQTDFVLVDVNKAINDSFLMLGEQLRLHNIKVKTDLESNLPKVQGNYNQLEQVFLNLITNARDAIGAEETKGPRRIEMVSRVVGASKDAVEILVKDTGSGIIDEEMGKIFDPFFTTKEVDKGTGLGLSISYGIIKDHKGEIMVAETGSDGTTFMIRLPIADLKTGKI